MWLRILRSNLEESCEISSDISERLRSLILRAREEREMDEELRFHVEMQAEQNRRAGMSVEDPRRQALIALGGVERFNEEWRDARGTRWLEDPVRDMRYALCRLARQPSFSVPVVLPLGVGIGAVAAIVALVTPSLFSVLGTTPVLGRLFVASDGQGNAPVPVVISHDLWVARYGADPGLIGRSIELNRVAHQVVGVLPAGFDSHGPKHRCGTRGRLSHGRTCGQVD